MKSTTELTDVVRIMERYSLVSLMNKISTALQMSPKTDEERKAQQKLKSAISEVVNLHVSGQPEEGQKPIADDGVIMYVKVFEDAKGENTYDVEYRRDMDVPTAMYFLSRVMERVSEELAWRAVELESYIAESRSEK